MVRESRDKEHLIRDAVREHTRSDGQAPRLLTPRKGDRGGAKGRLLVRGDSKRPVRETEYHEYVETDLISERVRFMRLCGYEPSMKYNCTKTTIKIEKSEIK